MEIVSVIAFASLVTKLVAVAKYVELGLWGKARETVYAWVAGVAVVALWRASGILAGFDLGDGTTVGSLNVAATILAGAAFGAAASVVLYDFRKAIDNGASSAEPTVETRAPRHPSQ